MTESELLIRLSRSEPIKLTEQQREYLEKLSMAFDVPTNKYDCPNCCLRRLIQKAREVKLC